MEEKMETLGPLKGDRVVLSHLEFTGLGFRG